MFLDYLSREKNRGRKTWFSLLSGSHFSYRQGSVQFSSVTHSCLTLCDPTDCSMPGFPVHHHFPELVQTHVHHIGDAIQPSHPLSPLLLLPSVFPSIRVFSNTRLLSTEFSPGRNIGVGCHALLCSGLSFAKTTFKCLMTSLALQ